MMVAGGDPATTNNRMELMAAIGALEALKRPCQVVLTTDSRYVMQGIEEWVPKWRANGWRTADRKPVKNQDLWQRLSDATSTHQRSEEHTSELQSLMRISYAVFCLKKKNKQTITNKGDECRR